MKNTLRYCIILCFIMSGLEGLSQNLSNRGREFFVAYGHHQFMEQGTNTQEMVIYLSAEQPAIVTVSINNTAWYRTYSIPANTVISTATATPIAGFPAVTPSFMPKSGTYDCRIYDIAPPAGNGGEGVYDRGIKISSDVPIVAYAHTFGSASSGATMLMPVETWGYSYISINSKQVYANNCFSWAYAIAQKDNTVIEIIPSVLTRNGRPPGVPFTITLDSGQVYQVIGANPTNSATALELSGTKFRSIANASGDCYPIAVFSGSSRTSNPISCGSGGGDNDNQQLFPIQAWGKRYLTAPTSRSSGPNQFMTNSYKVLVKDPATVVQRNGVTLTGLTNNYYFFESSTADIITADKPIMVAQFMTGGAGCGGTPWGDPEMIYISPVEQGSNRIGFFRNNAEAIQQNYLTMIVPSGGTGVSSVRIDGIPLSVIPAALKHVYTHPQNPNYTVIVRQWGGFAAYPAQPPGQCVVQSDSAFTAITYGLGSVESYGYNAGTLINNLNAISSIQNVPDPVTPEHPFTCVGTPIKLSALIAYQPTRIDWLLSQLGTAITPNADVIDMAPVSSATVVVNGVTYYKYTLPGTYVFNQADTFHIPIVNTHPSIENCYTREQLSIKIIVKEKPYPNFTFTHTGCEKDTVYFSGNSTTTNGYTATAWNWQFPGPTVATGQNVNHVFTPGTHNVTMSMVTNSGCSADTLKTITVNPKPVASIAAAPVAVCEDGSITFTPSATYFDPATLTSWYWDYGNGNTSTVTNSNPQNITYPDYGTFTVKHVVKASALCVSDTATTVVTVYAKPFLDFDYPAGCLPAGGVVQFNSNAAAPDGQTITAYTWDFGDPNATGGNPNTSVLQNPTHMYSDFGNYTITHSAMTANGCTRDTVVQATFNLPPTLQFTPLTAVCENVVGTVSVANGSVTNGVPGNGIYRGPATDAAGNFTPSLAGPGTHTIWYVFTSSAGCADSLSQNIQVYARPHPNFTFVNGCLAFNGQMQFGNQTTISDGQALTYLWNFDDPNATGSNPNTSTAQNPTHIFSEGSYDVNLQVTSANGCVSDTTIVTPVSILPQLSTFSHAPVCENDAVLSVATVTVLNGVTGTGVYSGPGTNAAGQFNPAVAGPGTHSITYTFTSTGGCVMTTGMNIVVRAKPRPSFTFPTGCLPTTGLAQFNNTSTIADGQTMTWAWNFDDPNANAGNPNTSTAQNPTHNFGEGSFDVSLTATSSGGCTEDTTIAIQFGVTPQLSFPPLTSVCENVTAFSIASATTTNGVTGTGTYSGPGTNAAGLFNPAVAGAGTHLITYSFTSAGGCSGTITSNITVYPRPISLFTLDNSICLNETLTVTNNSTIPSGSINTWNWDFGNGNTQSFNNGNPVTVTYASANTYTISLVTVSDRGCISLPFTQTVSVNALPVAAFQLPSGICMPGGSATFTNQSTLPGSGSLSYSWDFGDGNSSSNINPTHIYSAIGSYDVTLTAVSNAGCTNQVTQTLSDFYDRPTANFTVSPQELCQGMDNVFSDASNAPNSTIQTWTWNFDDGTTSNAQNPTKRFNNPGVFDVTLTVVSAQGCVSTVYTLPVTVHLQPVIDAGRSFVLPLGTQVQLGATANSTGLTFNWSPATGLSDPAILTPMLTATQDLTYVLTAVGDFNCTAQDSITVKILKPLNVPNIFTPNGDNIHDTWLIPNLADYPGATVEIFNRYGQPVFFSNGYSKPWDGTYKGTPLPVATYYYVIKLENGFKPITGSITIVR